MAKVWKLYSVRVLCLLSLAVAAESQTVALPTQTVPTDVFAGASTPATPNAPADLMKGGDSTLRLGTGDLIEVSVYNVPELNTKTRVGSSGDVYLPLVDYVHVAGLTINDAEAVIEKRLDQGGFVKHPHVQLFVSEYTSAATSLLGEVTKPGVYPVLGGQGIFDHISAAGGFTDKAGKTATVTHRGQASIAVPISRNLEDHPD